MSQAGKGILLESGTNELEVLVFTLGEMPCGVNVAKVREVIEQPRHVHVPRSHPAVIGVANLRGQVIPLVDLQLYFKPGQPSDAQQRHVIITEFNDLLMGFIVDGVEQIYRLGWETVEPAPSSMAHEQAAVTSICHVDERLVLMIDFEKIAFDIQGVNMSAEKVGESAAGFNRATKRILLAEDSPTMRNFMQQTIVSAGYRQLKICGDGQEAWEEIQRSIQGDVPPFDLIISDIEMPRMDGLHLCKRIKENTQLNDVPVVIFSSLVSDDNQKKMSAVHADMTLTKPQLVQLIEILDKLLTRNAEPVGV